MIEMDCEIIGHDWELIGEDLEGKLYYFCKICYIEGVE